MSEFTYRYGPVAEQQLVASGALASGEIIMLADKRAAWVLGLQAKASGDVYAVGTTGIGEAVCASAVTFSAGDAVHWDISANTAIAVGDVAVGDFYLGTAVKAKTDGQLVVTVDVNAVAGTVEAE